MTVIALIGGAASGKSTVSKILLDQGCVLIDADKVGHSLYNPGEPCVKQLQSVFGNDIIAVDGSIDRKKLGPLVFNNPENMKKLTDIVWPIMGKKIQDMIDSYMSSGAPCIVLEAAVFLEANWSEGVDRLIYVTIPEKEQLERLCKRNSIDIDRASNILKSQMSHEARIAAIENLGLPCHILDNSGSEEELKAKVNDFMSSFSN